ncbi:MAG: hypothetical protein U0792_16215 [Gemmataceae bacterium]
MALNVAIIPLPSRRNWRAAEDFWSMGIKGGRPFRRSLLWKWMIEPEKELAGRSI